MDKIYLAHTILESDLSNIHKKELLQFVRTSQLDESALQEEVVTAIALGSVAALYLGYLGTLAALTGWQIAARTATRCRRVCMSKIGPQRIVCHQRCNRGKYINQIKVIRTEGMAACGKKRNPDKCRKKLQKITANLNKKVFALNAKITKRQTDIDYSKQR